MALNSMGTMEANWPENQNKTSLARALKVTEVKRINDCKHASFPPLLVCV